MRLPTMAAAVLLSLSTGAVASAEEASAAMRPDWCGSYKPSAEDATVRWVDTLVGSEGFSLRTLSAMAVAACDSGRWPAGGSST
jgi:hypothetical protein